MDTVGTQRLWTRANGHTYQTHCKNGHEFTTQSTYISPKSQKRSCRICTTARIKERRVAEPALKERNKLHMQKWRAANRTRDRKNWTDLRFQKKVWLDAYKREHPCTGCGEADISCLDFHHRDPMQKLGTVSIKVAHWSLQRLELEIAKCDILCANCHRKLHAKER